MLIKVCFTCKYHRIKREEEREMSYCSKENCWAAYSDCTARKALNRFLQDEAHPAFVANTAS